ncbi:uncharacterized protein LOC126881504 [Diabrotica virgifera virgifera]|uniref:Uncharacterized protein n=2 Tax=Diabrotica virgifera virgifera TaxID=50390 RepID=A0ABM5JUY4_DIAVI|nr:uncharacterized protein LOC126881504 [Diabrotica virgifera virgifera]
MSVKTILVFGITALSCISFVSSVGPHMPPEKWPFYDECLKESGASADDLKVSPFKMSHEIICFLKCHHEKAENIDKDGKIKPDLLIKQIKEHMELTANQEKSILDCLGKVPKINVCEDIKEVYKCLKALKH